MSPRKLMNPLIWKENNELFLEAVLRKLIQMSHITRGGAFRKTEKSLQTKHGLDVSSLSVFLLL